MEENIPDDPVEMYLREVANVEALSKEEEATLFQQLEQSNVSHDQKESVARRLIESQLASVVHLAKKYSSTVIPALDLDLIQPGNLGLMSAVRSYALEPVGDFHAYAAARIEAEMQKFLREPK